MKENEHSEDFETELCPGCLNENIPGTHFCRKCGSPLSTYAATGPWESIQAERHIFANAASNPQKPISVIGIWLIFGGMWAMGTFLTILCSEAITNPAMVDGLPGLLAGLFFMFIGGFVTIRTTVNYLKRKGTG